MFAHNATEPRSRFLEEKSPRIGIEMLGLEHRDEVMVAELRKRPVDGFVPLALSHQKLLTLGIFAARCIAMHVVEILLVAIGRHTIDTPMAIDAELGIAQPFGHRGML